MKLLISPINEKEAEEAIAGGADIIDVKNPKEGALGANFPWVIKRIKEMTPKKLEVSCTLGEVGNLPGSVSLAALGAASLGVNYIKVGLHGIKTPQEAVVLLQNVGRAAKNCNNQIKVAVTGYADAERIGAIDPLLIPEIAHKSQVDVAMIDTSIKDGKNLFDYLTVEQLKKFVNCAHGFGLNAALAGSLGAEHLPVVYSLDADIAGLRGAACTKSNRIKGHITRKLVRELVEVIRKAEDQVGQEKI